LLLRYLRSSCRQGCFLATLLIRDIAFKFYCDNQSAALLQGLLPNALSAANCPFVLRLCQLCVKAEHWNARLPARRSVSATFSLLLLHLACLATNLNAISRLIKTVCSAHIIFSELAFYFTLPAIVKKHLGKHD